MPRPEKVEAVEQIKARFRESDGVILTEYRGLRVADMQRLRRELKEAGIDYKIVKNTLARLAVAEFEYSEIEKFFEGPVAIAFYDDDPVPAAKLLKAFSTENPALVIKGGLLSGEVLDDATARKLAELDSRETLLAKIAGTMEAPMTKMAGAASAVIRNFAYALGSYVSQREQDAPSPEEAQEEPELESGESNEAGE